MREVEVVPHRVWKRSVGFEPHSLPRFDEKTLWTSGGNSGNNDVHSWAGLTFRYIDVILFLSPWHTRPFRHRFR